MKISRRVENIPASLTLEITAQAKKMRQLGQAVVNFAAGEPDFDTPEYIKEAAIKAIKAGQTKYTPSTGTPELKQAIAQKLEQDNKLKYSPAQIIVTCGAKHALYNILQVVCEKGDEVLIASPYWVSYPPMVSLAEATPCIVETSPDKNFKFDQASLKRHINKKTKVLILNSPGNPTGSVYSRDELKEISEVAVRHNLYVISDEIYEKLIYDGKQHISCASLNKEIYQRTIIVNGVSKTYSMTGWRIGYLACPNQEIIQAISNLQDHSTSNPCSISQKAAGEAIAATNKEQINAMVKEFQLKRDCMLEGLKSICGLSCIKPEGAFYIFCNIAKIGLDSLKFAQRLLQEAKVAAIPGKAFGKDDFIRFSFATSHQQIEEGVSRLKDWVGKIS